MRDCPRKEKLNAIIAKDGENSGSDAPMRANPLQLLNVIRANATHKGLMYVELLTGEQKIMALVDRRQWGNPQLHIDKGDSQTQIEAH